MSLYIVLSAEMNVLRQAFSPEHILVYVMAAFLISVFVLLFYNRMYIFREQDVKAKSKNLNGQLALVLQTGNLRLWVYDVVKRHYMPLSEDGVYGKEYNPIEFAEFFDRDDFEVMRKSIFDVCEGRIETASNSLKSNPKKTDKQHFYDIKFSVLEKDQNAAK